MRVRTVRKVAVVGVGVEGMGHVRQYRSCAQRLERRNSSTGTFIDRSRSEAHPEHLGKTEHNHEDEIHCTFISIPGVGQCDADQNGSS